MNLQKPPHGIEWTRLVTLSGKMLRGYTWNPVSGCEHRCRWTMGDKVVKCYAESVAEGLAQTAYPLGFSHVQFHPERLEEPLRVKQPAGIFLDSMSDLMGVGVQRDWIEQVLNVCRQAHWHQFILLTKNPKRLLQFDFPPNVWVLMSSSPDFMYGREMTQTQQKKFLEVGVETLLLLRESKRARIVGLSAEPLSWDIAPVLRQCYYGTEGLDWIIIGAGSDGRTYYQPEREHVASLIRLARVYGGLFSGRVFFKGNLDHEELRLPLMREFPPRWQLGEDGTFD